MGREWTEERRAKYEATMAAKRSGGGRAVVIRSIAAPALVDTVATAMPQRITNGSVLSLLDAAIVSAAADVAALERAREILLRRGG